MMMMRSLAVGGNNLNNVRLRIIWLFALSVLPRCMIEHLFFNKGVSCKMDKMNNYHVDDIEHGNDDDT